MSPDFSNHISTTTSVTSSIHTYSRVTSNIFRVTFRQCLLHSMTMKTNTFAFSNCKACRTPPMPSESDTTKKDRSTCVVAVCSTHVAVLLCTFFPAAVRAAKTPANDNLVQLLHTHIQHHWRHQLQLAMVPHVLSNHSSRQLLNMPA